MGRGAANRKYTVRLKRVFPAFPSRIACQSSQIVLSVIFILIPDSAGLTPDYIPGTRYGYRVEDPLTVLSAAVHLLTGLVSFRIGLPPAAGLQDPAKFLSVKAAGLILIIDKMLSVIPYPHTVIQRGVRTLGREHPVFLPQLQELPDRPVLPQEEIPPGPHGLQSESRDHGHILPAHSARRPYGCQNIFFPQRGTVFKIGIQILESAVPCQVSGVNPAHFHQIRPFPPQKRLLQSFAVSHMGYLHPVFTALPIIHLHQKFRNRRRIICSQSHNLSRRILSSILKGNSGKGQHLPAISEKGNLAHQRKRSVRHAYLFQAVRVQLKIFLSPFPQAPAFPGFRHPGIHAFSCAQEEPLLISVIHRKRCRRAGILSLSAAQLREYRFIPLHTVSVYPAVRSRRDAVQRFQLRPVYRLQNTVRPVAKNTSVRSAAVENDPAVPGNRSLVQPISHAFQFPGVRLRPPQKISLGPVLLQSVGFGLLLPVI